jgi:hypothetical protein
MEPGPMRLHAEAKIEVQFHRIAFARTPFSIESIAALAAFSEDQKKACVERGHTIKMSP